MRVAVRADASIQIGTGHVMRCLTLAEELRRRGAEVLFICRQHQGNLCGLISDKGFDVGCLPDGDATLDELPASPVPPSEHRVDESLSAYADWLGADWRQDAAQTAEAVESFAGVDWLVVDHYALDDRWESRLRAVARRILVIDDLADRAHDCDLLLDQNYYKDMSERYQGLLSESCSQLLGPRHALLRKEFAVARRDLGRRDGSVKKILVFFGGVDRQNMTAVALDAIALLERPGISVDVVVGATNPHLASIGTRWAADPRITIHVQVEDIARLMVSADLSIGGVGSTAWERCYVELPSLVVSMADNQTRAAEDLAALGAVRYLGSCEDVDAMTMARSLEECVTTPSWLRRMAGHCRGLMGLDAFTGSGADSVCDAMMKQIARC